MAPSAKDDEAALGSTFTADCRVGAPHILGEGAVADDGAVEGYACPHCHLVLPTACFTLKDAQYMAGNDCNHILPGTLDDRYLP